MQNGLEDRLAMAGDDYDAYAAVMARAGHVNIFELLEEAAQLARIKQVLDEKAGWTAAIESKVPPTVEERVTALVNFTEQRMVEQ